VSFYEERFGSLGPLGRLGQNVCYPAEFRPTENTERYPTGAAPAENFFNLRKPTSPQPTPAPRKRAPE